MDLKNLYIADVIANDSSQSPSAKKNGSVKIKVPELMSGWQDPHLPWARPFHLGGGGQSTSGSSMIPETGAKIWVFCEKTLLKKNWYYLADFIHDQTNPIQAFDSVTQSVTQATLSSAYPDWKFILLKNNLAVGMSSNASNPEFLISHPKGTYIVIDSNGKITVDCADDVFMKVTGNVIMEGTKVYLGQDNATGKVVTTDTDPVVDNITGAPHVGSTTVFAKS